MGSGPETEEWLAETATGDSYVLLSLPTVLLTVPDPEPTPVAGPERCTPLQYHQSRSASRTVNMSVSLTQVNRNISYTGTDF